MTIQAALTASSSNDSVLIAPGVYLENLDSGPKFISLIGTGGPGSAVVDGRGIGRCLRLGEGGRLIGITFSNGFFNGFGGGVFVVFASLHGKLFIDGCIFSGNIGGSPDQGGGGGLYVDVGGTDVQVRHCTFANNRSGLQGGGVLASGGVWEDNVFLDNYAWTTGGGMSGGREVRRSLFVRNTARNAGGGYSSSIRVLEDNTFVGNRHQNGFAWGAGIDVDGGGIVRRNIVVGSEGLGSAGTGIFYRLQPGFPFASDFSCNDSWGNSGANFIVAGIDTTGDHNFSLDPKFCNAAIADYSLEASSPCSDDNSPCGRIGAFGVGCQPIIVQQTTWSRIKNLVRS